MWNSFEEIICLVWLGLSVALDREVAYAVEEQRTLACGGQALAVVLSVTKAQAPPRNACATGKLGVEEGAGFVAGPEVGEDDDAGDCGVGAPEGSEGVAFEEHDGEENDEICCAEDDHHSNS